MACYDKAVCKYMLNHLGSVFPPLRTPLIGQGPLPEAGLSQQCPNLDSIPLISHDAVLHLHSYDV